MVRTRRRRPNRPKGEPEEPARVSPLPRFPVSGSLPIKVDSRRMIRALAQKVFPIVGHLEGQPRVTGLWLSADVLDRRPGQLTVHYRGYFAGVPLESVQRVTLQPPHRVEFRQTRGGLRALQGLYSLQPVEGETELTMTVEADIGIPLIPDAAAARVLRGYVERTLDKIKLTAERELPRVVRRPKEEPAAQPADAAAAAAAEEAVVRVEPAEAEAALSAVPPPVPEAPALVPTERKRRRRRRRGRRRTSSPSPPSD